jgi:hypothetical protein
MPLVFVHGVATRPSAEYEAMVAQRDELFRSLVFEGSDVTIVNPNWGSFGVQFGEDLPWLPYSTGNEAFGAGEGEPANQDLGPASLDSQLALGVLAGRDAEQAIDLVSMAALDAAIREATRLEIPGSAAKGDAIRLAKASAEYLGRKGISDRDAPAAVPALTVGSNAAFGDALEVELDEADANLEGFGVGDTIRGAISHLTRLIGNSASDAVLKVSRRSLSRGVSLFMGDIFVYLRGRDLMGADGTRDRIFKPIIEALIAGAKAPRSSNEPFLVVGHSLGGVILYDILTDADSVAQIQEAVGGEISIDALFTVGSQPGFFADLGLYPGGRPAAGKKLPMPNGVERWMNIFDFTDIFSFRCEHIFEGVKDFGYDTVTDLIHAHGSYFLRPSFYKRMRARLKEAPQS